MKKNLFEEERMDNDLENLSLEDLLEEEALAPKSNKTKEVLKQAGTKTLDVSKKVAVNVKDKAEEVYQEKRAEYEYNKQNGIDNFDDKAKKALDGYGLAATFYKWQMNRNLKKVLADEEQEKGQKISYFIKGFLFNSFGILGLIGYYVGFLIAVVMLIEIMRAGVIVLIPLFLILKYAVIHNKYLKNAKFFDFKWYLDLIKKEPGYRGINARNTYLIIPSTLFNIDNELENYLENRGKKNMASGQREYASISNSKVIFDERYGYVRVFEISNLFFRKSVDKDGLESVELNDYFLIPRQNNNHEFTNDVYYQVHGEVWQCIAPLMSQMSLDEFINLIVTDDSINYAFPEIAEKLEAEKEKAMLDAQALKEKEEQQKMYEAFEEKGLNDRAIKIIIKLKKNQELYGISVRDLFGRSMEFTKNYLKVRVDLMDGTSIEQVSSNASKIGSKVGIKPTILKAENASSAYLMFVLNDNIKGHKVSVDDIKKEASEGYLTLGEGLLGPIKIEFPRGDSPSFGLIGGLSRSGKSTLGTMMFTAMSYLNDNQGNYDYTDFFIASVKDEDYIANGFKDAGMLVVSDVFEIYNMLKLVDELATKRKDEFLAKNTINIGQYNKVSEQKMGKIMVIMDEYANTLTKASNYKIDTDAGNIALNKAIEALVVKIAQEHGSRGVSLFILTQQFSKGAIGDAADVLGSRFLGYAKENVWSSQDPTKKISAYLKTMEDTTKARRGRFFISAPDFGFTDDTKVQKIGSEWAEVKTNFADTEEYEKNYDRKFDTASKYLSSIQNNNNDEATSYTSALSDDDI